MIPIITLYCFAINQISSTLDTEGKAHIDNSLKSRTELYVPFPTFFFHGQKSFQFFSWYIELTILIKSSIE